MRPDFWLQKQPEFLLGFLLIVIGILTGLVFLLKRKSSELYILYLAVFIVGYGARVLADNELLRMSVDVPRDFWEYIDAAVTDLLPVVFIIFLQSFIGWITGNQPEARVVASRARVLSASLRLPLPVCRPDTVTPSPARPPLRRSFTTRGSRQLPRVAK